jgi:hypothetical protein
MIKTLPAILISHLIITFLFVPASYAANEQKEIVKLEGREVILNKDGSWQYRSEDRYAQTTDGRRVLIKQDGSWQHVGNAPLKTKQQVRTNKLNIKLEKVVIETYKQKVQKNTRIKTQTVFYVRVKNSSNATKSVYIKDHDIERIEVKDNNGKTYPVLSLKAVTEEITPDAETQLIVRADKSPAIWDDVKSMEIIFKAGIFGLKSPVALNQRTIDFDEKDVDGFEQ